jgi:acyl phosphate:glycerol-3-phosphate acyltransferase
MTTAIFICIGYLAGSLPFAYWVARAFKGIDIRHLGSGNVGASNVWRSFGAVYGLPVAALDTAKGFAPAFVATIVAGHLAGVLAGGAAMLGHSRPLFLGFRRGGKMVATGGGAFFGVAPLLAASGAAVWILVFAAFRYASIASIVAAFSLPVSAAVLGEPWPVIALAVAAAIGVPFLHRGNIARLRAGTEPRSHGGTHGSPVDPLLRRSPREPKPGSRRAKPGSAADS